MQISLYELSSISRDIVWTSDFLFIHLKGEFLAVILLDAIKNKKKVNIKKTNILNEDKKKPLKQYI